MITPHRKKIPLSLEIAPLVDIVLLLLIFFLLTSSLDVQSMHLELPEASTAQERTESLIVVITRQGNISVEGKQVDLEILLPLLRSEVRQGNIKTVTIEADAHVPLKIPIQVMDMCRQAGAEGVSIATRKTGGE